MPSGLRDPSNRQFSESRWCQLSKFSGKFKYRDKYKDKYRDKYKDKDKWREKVRHQWCHIFSKSWWQKNSEYDLGQAGSKKIQRQTQRQIQEQPTDLWCYVFLERRWQKESDYGEYAEYANYFLLCFSFPPKKYFPFPNISSFYFSVFFLHKKTFS